MRISDWSSDVCSSDLLDALVDRQERIDGPDIIVDLDVIIIDRDQQVGNRLGRQDQTRGISVRFFGLEQRIAAALGDAGFRRSEEHTSELQSLMRISYAVFCL